MIKEVSGNIFDSECLAYVNPVNTMGISGKGLAKEFKELYPKNFHEYKRACRDNKCDIGKVFVHQYSFIEPPYYIINFPTKKEWWLPSKVEYIEQGLVDLWIVCSQLKIESVAMPALGCGLGGLRYEGTNDSVLSIILNSYKNKFDKRYPEYVELYKN